jgi:hypothetical protein
MALRPASAGAALGPPAFRNEGRGMGCGFAEVKGQG